MKMNPNYDDMSNPFKEPRPIGADAEVPCGDVDLDDPFDAILDKALEAAFAPIVEEFRMAREQRWADLDARIADAKARSLNG